MAGTIDERGPTYIVAHSADVILSDIRPIKLKLEPLRAINILLDELLYTILSVARSLTTDKLKVALLQILPTSLGKEALLEAEVELRAYWDRVGTAAATESDAPKSFNLAWTFELLRLKCEGYSTLNESDEDATAEARLNDRFSKTGGAPPNPALVAPAALYLTAILESLCEHILTNVGRVAARDSSRTSATIQDLFTALCEDHSVYVLFKSMKVHEQIESLSKVSKPSRSRSFTRDETGSLSRNTSPVQGKASVTTPRSSVDKAMQTKMFNPPKPTQNPERGTSRDVEDQHQRSDSVLSFDTRKTLASYDIAPGILDAELQQEFDNLMRSDSTLKVSLTPDRLKTMEVHNKDRHRGTIRTSSQSNGVADFSLPAAKGSVHRSVERTGNGVRRVDSITENDENTRPSQSTNRYDHNKIETSSVSSNTSFARFRSLSTSGTMGVNMLRKSSIKGQRQVPPPQYPARMNNDQPPKRHAPPPPRGTKIVVPRESMDLDEVIAGSGEDESEEAPPVPPPTTKPQSAPAHHVSASTRALMDFLADGPPEVSQPPLPLVEPTKPKSSSRLQKMLSRLTIGHDRHSRASSTGVESTISSIAPQTLSASLNWRRSQTNLPITTYPPPVPPPPPAPLIPLLSPPSSPSQASADANTPPAPTPPSHLPSASRKILPPKVPKNLDEDSPNHSLDLDAEPIAPKPPPKLNLQRQDEDVRVERPSSSGARSPTLPSAEPVMQDTPAVPEVHPSSSQRAATPPPDVRLRFSVEEAHTIHRLMARATTADECRVLLDMFFARAGLPVSPALPPADENPYPSPTPSPPAITSIPGDSADPSAHELECFVLELLLGSQSDGAQAPTMLLQNLMTEAGSADAVSGTDASDSAGQELITAPSTPTCISANRSPTLLEQDPIKPELQNVEVAT